MEELLLANNQLQGAIPPELGHLANLESLGLSDNYLRRAISPSLGNHAQLVWLMLGGSNRLTGCIPAGLQDAKFNDLDELGCRSAGPTEARASWRRASIPCALVHRRRTPGSGSLRPLQKVGAGVGAW